MDYVKALRATMLTGFLAVTTSTTADSVRYTPVADAFPRTPIWINEWFFCSSPGCFEDYLYETPDNKLLVIEKVSVQIRINGAGDYQELPFVHLLAPANPDSPSNNVHHFIEMNRFGPNRLEYPATQFSGSESLRVYVQPGANPGSTVGISVELPEGVSNAEVNTQITGYLLPLNSPTLHP